MTQMVLPLHECAAEPLQDAAESIADPTIAGPATAEPLHSIVDTTSSDATLTETFFLCIQV
jgi:hypothetical protein